MKIEGFTDRLKTALSEDMKVESKRGNIILEEGAEPVKGWNVYTYWTGLEGGMVGLQIGIADSFLEKMNEKYVKATGRIIKSARERHEGVLLDDEPDPYKDVPYK